VPLPAPHQVRPAAGPGGSGLCPWRQLVEEGGAVDEDPRQTARTDKPAAVGSAGGDGEDQAPTLDPLERALRSHHTPDADRRQVVELHP